MSKALRNSLIAIAVIVGAAALALAGISFGRAQWNSAAYWPGGMMGGSGQVGASYGHWGSMMGSFGPIGSVGVEPLSLSEAEKALEAYLDGIADSGLEIGEIMIFDNHAYAELVETSTGVGAMEVLVDPVTLAVYPEHGPNMMWNLKYSPMAGSGMMGMMTGSSFGQDGAYGGMMASQSTLEVSADMPVLPDEAVRIAQRYLDANAPGTEVDDEADVFYGYYTLHILQDGETAGMLSVNGYTREVFVHTWHGDFIEMTEDH